MQDYINLIKNSQKLVGLKQVIAGIINDTVRCVLVSCDSDDFIMRAIADVVSTRDIPISVVCNKRKLGKLCGIDVACAVVGILKDSHSS